MEQVTAPERNLETLVTPAELARAFKTSPQTINCWHRKGIIPAALACGRVVRFDKAEVLEALAKRKEQA